MASTLPMEAGARPVGGRAVQVCPVGLLNVGEPQPVAQLTRDSAPEGRGLCAPEGRSQHLGSAGHLLQRTD